MFCGALEGFDFAGRCNSLARQTMDSDIVKGSERHNQHTGVVRTNGYNHLILSCSNCTINRELVFEIGKLSSNCS